MIKQRRSPLRLSNYYTKLFLLGLFWAPSVLVAQTQAKFITPSLLSSCNKDTICVEITNSKGAKNTVYSGNVTLEVDIPGGNLVGYVAGALMSLPAGVTQVSYSNNKLVASLPLPTLGSTTKVCFVVRPDCNVTNLTELPNFKGKVTYPASYPVASEVFESGALNTGSAILNHTTGGNYAFNPTVSFGGDFYRHQRISNGGYGNIDEVTVSYIVPNDLTMANASNTVYGGTLPEGSTGGVILPESNVVYDANHKLVTFKLKGRLLGGDGLLTPGEYMDFYTYTLAPNYCGVFPSKTFTYFSCGTGQPLCQKPDTLVSTVKVTAGIPKIEGRLIAAESADGCPNKAVSFFYKNTGAGNAAPVGNAYDIDLGISFGGGKMTISNVKLNNTLISTFPIALTPSGVGTEFTMKIKDKLRLDPDGAGVGLEDLDGDGYFDDMKSGDSTRVDFNYTIPCELACGSDLHYQLQSHATYTDFCRVIVGNEYTPLKEFGFRQEQPIEQVTTVNYATIGIGQSETKNVRFNFKFQQFNMDLTAATAELRIRYSRKMEFETNSLKLFGTPIPSASITIRGLNTPGDAVNDLDSMAVYTLSAAEVAMLFDNNPDSLSYSQTYYGCADRQNSSVGDNWQLLVRTKPGLCTDGSTPCNFDLSCRKPFVYGSSNGCGTPYCIVPDMEFKRISKIGYTDVTETAPLVTAPTRLYERDTALLRMGSFSTADKTFEPTGYYTSLGRPDLDGQFYFSFNYSVPKGYDGVSPWKFLPTYSTVCVYQRTPDPSDPLLKGTIGALLFEAPILVNDFQNFLGYNPTDESMLPNGFSYTYPLGNASSPAVYCTNYPNTWTTVNCPLIDKINYSNSLWNNRYYNTAGDKITDTYNLNCGKSLSRAGWTGNLGDDNYYIEIKSKWQMREEFPWDNTNSYSFKGGYTHNGNLSDVPQSAPNSTYGGSCNLVSANGTTVTKEHFISNPKSVYNADCGLKVAHKVDFKSYAGDYFNGGEVRVPLKIDSIVVDIPTEYGITTGTIALQYNQNCTNNNYTNITASASTGHIKFTNGAGGDFPRADDCSGFTTAYSLCYTLQKNGTAAPTLYRFPIKIYTKDEYGIVKILTDSASISEAKPVLTLTPVSPIFNIADGGACQPFYVDYLIENNSLYDAPSVYFAAESSAGTTIMDIGDGQGFYEYPLSISDVSNYATNNKFAKLGTLKSGDKRYVRVYATTAVCTDNFNVYTDFGCAYPAPLQPDLGTTTFKTASANYTALAPTIVSRLISDINVTNLCDNKTIEIEVRNARLANIYNLKAGFKLPAGTSYVPNTAMIKYSATTGTYTAIAAGDIAFLLADSLILDLKNSNPFNTVCGLTGADTAVLNTLRLKFDISLNACPSSYLSNMPYNILGENYCGTSSNTHGNVRINYIGTGGTKNNYSLSPSAKALNICALKNQTQAIADTLFIKNEGGYGVLSGATSGLDSMTLAIPFDLASFTVSNFTVLAPFSSPVFGTNAQGQMTMRVLIPAGVAIGSTIAMPVTYDITMQKDSVCLLHTAPHLCFFAEFSTPFALECAAKSLNCTALTKTVVGTGISLRAFECCSKTVDLALTKTVNTATTAQGTNVVFILKVKNEGTGDATGVSVHDTLPVGMTFISATPIGVYDAATKLWTIGNLAKGDSTTLTMTVRMDSVGINYNTAEVHTVNETDTDSSPNNGSPTEDDIARVCVSVPIKICTGQSFVAALPSGLTGIKWYKNGVEIVGQTATSLSITQSGDYTFTANESTCPVEGCCPIKIEVGSCTILCKPVICLPVVVARQ